MSLILHYPLNERRLPIDYEKVDYIESNGHQFIDTEWIPDYGKGFKVEVECSFYAVGTSGRACIMSNYNDGSHLLSFEIIYLRSRYYALSGAIDNYSVAGTMQQGIKNTLIFEYDNDVYTLTVNNRVISSGTYAMQEACTSSVWLFLDRALRTTTFTNKFRLHHLKIYEAGLLIHEYIPCYDKENLIPGLYDLVNDVFYMNLGEGEFMCKYKSPVLPSEYQEVSFIQTDGSSYIDTNYSAESQKIAVELSFKCDTTACFLVGTGRWSTYTLLLHNNGTTTVSCYNTNSTAMSIAKEDRLKWTEIYTEPLYARCRNTTYTASAGTINADLFEETIKFGGGCTTATYNKPVMFKYLNIYDDGILVKLYIPCYRISDNEPGMYDLIGGEFYTNEGDGSFIVGPDVVDMPNEYQLVEYIETQGYSRINTGILGTSDIKLETLAHFVTSVSLQTLLSTYNGEPCSNGSIEIYLNGNNCYAYSWVTSNWTNTNLAVANYTSLPLTIIYDINNLKAQIKNGSTYLYNANMTAFSSFGTDPIYLFQRTRLGNLSYCRMYYFKVYKTDILTNHFIPCYRKSDHCPGMLDILTNTFYENELTTGFLLGEDIKDRDIKDTHTILDASGNNINGTVVYGSLIRTNPYQRDSYSLDLTNKGNINTGYEWNPTNFTVSVWFQRTDLSSIQGCIFRNDSKYSPTIDFSNNQIRGFFWYNSSSYIMKTWDCPTDANWHHVALTYDGSKFVFYLDGNNVNTSTTLTPYNSGTLILGYNSTSLLLKNVLLSDFKIYDNSLTVSEIQQIYNERQ